MRSALVSTQRACLSTQKALGVVQSTDLGQAVCVGTALLPVLSHAFPLRSPFGGRQAPPPHWSPPHPTPHPQPQFPAEDPVLGFLEKVLIIKY